MDKPHVLGRLTLVGQGVAGERPVYREVEAVPHSVGDTQSEHQRHRTWIEGYEDDRNERLGRAGNVKERLSAMQATEDQAAKKSEGKGGEHHDRSQFDVKVSGLVVEG